MQNDTDLNNAPLSNLTVLVVDDDILITGLMQTLLAMGRNWNVIVTNSVFEALKELETLTPDVIISDLMMPTMSGFDFLRLIKKCRDKAQIPFIVVSAKEDTQTRDKCFSLGANAYITKPFDIDHFLSMVSKYDNGPKQNKLNPIEERVYFQSEVIELLKDLYIDVEQENITQARINEGLKDELRDLKKSWRWRMGKPNTNSKEPEPTNASIAELSRFTNGIVHDMRNGLGVIRNTVGFMSEDFVHTPHEKDILKISRSLDFCEVILRNLSALGGQDIFRPSHVDLKEVVKEICFMLESKLVDVDVVIDAADEKAVIWADEGNMKQVFMNLVKNAGEAMPNGGTLTFRFKKDGGMMRVDVQDTGWGISKEILKRLFYEFITTKELGYGVGLMVVRTIIERHGGKISVDSELGKGTIFTILLPIKENQ